LAPVFFRRAATSPHGLVRRRIVIQANAFFMSSARRCLQPFLLVDRPLDVPDPPLTAFDPPVTAFTFVWSQHGAGRKSITHMPVTRRRRLLRTGLTGNVANLYNC
jgi:hypothetical protein